MQKINSANSDKMHIMAVFRYRKRQADKQLMTNHRVRIPAFFAERQGLNYPAYIGIYQIDKCFDNACVPDLCLMRNVRLRSLPDRLRGHAPI